MINQIHDLYKPVMHDTHKHSTIICFEANQESKLVAFFAADSTASPAYLLAPA